MIVGTVIANAQYRHAPHVRTLVGLVLILFGTAWLPTSASAVSRTCSSDPVANTAAVLCASPSGPCDAAQVILSTNVEVMAGGCAFDIGGRALRIEKTLQMTGSGVIAISNATNITITSAGKLKARGDFVLVNGTIIQGGSIELVANGAINSSGVIDVSGDPAGDILLSGGTAVSLLSGSSITANGISSFVDDRQRFSDGGLVELDSASGAVSISGTVSALGANAASGGVLLITAATDLAVAQTVDVTGGGGDGGSIDAVAGDNIRVTRTIDASSRLGGGSGGDITLTAGDDSQGGIVTGGTLEINDARVKARGSAADTSGGDGGIIFLSASGLLRVLGTNASIDAQATTAFDGAGGYVALDSSDDDAYTIGARDGDLDIRSPIIVEGGNTSSLGGSVDAIAGRDASFAGTISTGGTLTGGDVFMLASGSLTVDGVVTAAARTAGGDGGDVDINAGYGRSAGVTIRKSIYASGGQTNSWHPIVHLSGCSIAVDPDAVIDGRGGSASGGGLGGAAMTFLARGPTTFGLNSQIKAGPGGTVTTMHPAAYGVVLGQGVVIEPARTDSLVEPGIGGLPYPPCGQ